MWTCRRERSCWSQRWLGRITSPEPRHIYKACGLLTFCFSFRSFPVLSFSFLFCSFLFCSFSFFFSFLSLSFSLSLSLSLLCRSQHQDLLQTPKSNMAEKKGSHVLDMDMRSEHQWTYVDLATPKGIKVAQERMFQVYQPHCQV